MDLSATILLTDLAQLGIEIGYDGDRLWCRPQTAVTPELIDRLKTHKAELLVELKSGESAGTAAPANAPAPPSTVGQRFNGIMHARTAELIARNRPCPDALMSEPASDEWITVNEQNWLNARDEDVDYLIGPRNWPTSRCLYCDGYLVHGEDCRALHIDWIPKLEFGKHKGKRLDETPTDYLRWLLKSDAIKDAEVRNAVRAVLGIPERGGG